MPDCTCPMCFVIRPQPMTPAEREGLVNRQRPAWLKALQEMPRA